MVLSITEGAAFEKHYKPAELAKLWGYSTSKIRRLFAEELGVMRMGEPTRRLGKKLRRKYISMSIPASVAVRVHHQLTKVPKVA